MCYSSTFLYIFFVQHYIIKNRGQKKGNRKKKFNLTRLVTQTRLMLRYKLANLPLIFKVFKSILRYSKCFACLPRQPNISTEGSLYSLYIVLVSTNDRRMQLDMCQTILLFYSVIDWSFNHQHSTSH